MSELPTPISDQDKLLSNIAIGTPSIDDLIPNSRQEVYLKYIATKGMNGNLEFPIPIANGGTGATTETGVRENLEVYKEYVLYENTSGTTGTVTLSDSAENYKKITVVYSNLINYVQSVTFFPNFKNGLMLNSLSTNSDATIMSFSNLGITFNGSSVTRSLEGHWEYLSSSINKSTNTGIRIYKIIGYKY